MIPRHSLPFGVRKILSILLSSSSAMNSQEVEKAYADALGVHTVLLLPSVRAGTHMAILAAGEPSRVVAGPAYTCHTMHEALALSGASIRLVDSAPGSFLMPPEGICAATEPGCVIVLSEVYGIPYDPDFLQKACKKEPGIRVFDMAMSIPSPKRMRQLQARDVALFSFGWGKPMYAGWGGIACFQDPALADRVREIRDRWTIQESFGLSFRRGSSALLRVVANQRFIYGLSHERHLYSLYRRTRSSRSEHSPSFLAEGGTIHPSSGLTARTLPQEWTRPMTGLNRNLAMNNLHNSVQNSGLRRSQAEIYSRSLVESGIVRGPGSNTLPQSHFPVRLPSAIRNAMCDYLRSRGIDTSTLFPFPAGLSRADYPNAAQAADEVIILPIGPTITLDEVRMISGYVKEGLQTLGL